VLIDKEKHRWTNAIPNEQGHRRPDAVISSEPQLDYESSLGHGEAKISQVSKYSLCMNTFRLVVFNKSTIDINKLDGAIASQIHGKARTKGVDKEAIELTTPFFILFYVGFNIKFYLTRLTAAGFYSFVEIPLSLISQSLLKISLLLLLYLNLKKLIAINETFWSQCKQSTNPEKIADGYKPTLLDLDEMIDAT
jgi:hypothetical protein